MRAARCSVVAADASCDILRHGREVVQDLLCIHMPTLPLWIVTEHIKPSDPNQTSKTESGAALAFSSPEKLFKFVKE